MTKGAGCKILLSSAGASERVGSVVRAAHGHGRWPWPQHLTPALTVGVADALLKEVALEVALAVVEPAPEGVALAVALPVAEAVPVALPLAVALLVADAEPLAVALAVALLVAAALADTAAEALAREEGVGARVGTPSP
jgi:hypothetical protein